VGNNQVICVGNAAVDVPLSPVDRRILTIDSYPIDRIIPMTGGSGINVSTILSRLGVRTALVTLLGTDMLGDFLMRHCEDSGIDTAYIIRSSEADTPLFIGLVREDGERTFVVGRSSSTFRFNASHVDFDCMNGAKLLTFASIFIMPQFDDEGLTTLFAEAKKRGLIVCADMMKSRKEQRLDSIRNCLYYVDHFFANLEEAAFLTGKDSQDKMADELLDAGTGHVIIKDGARGCYVASKEFRAECPAYHNEHVVDTIGAGDNFVAGYICALLEQKSFIDCAKAGNAVASISVGFPGATGGVKSREQIQQQFGQYFF
jgi:sugar/nucleoside kinase (ribokinase family)